MKWDAYAESGSWTCVLDEGFFGIYVCDDGTFDVNNMPLRLKDVVKPDTFSTLALAKAFCEERWARYVEEQKADLEIPR